MTGYVIAPPKGTKIGKCVAMGCKKNAVGSYGLFFVCQEHMDMCMKENLMIREFEWRKMGLKHK